MRQYYLTGSCNHVHVLIQMGHQRLNLAKYRSSEEPDITGELVKEINEAKREKCAPRWAQYYSVHDNMPLNTPGRLGKRRRVVDIGMASETRGRAWEFQFEAKRLRDTRSVSNYLGNEGLGCFFAGRNAYAREQESAGMLGYVQTNDEATWANKIGSRLGRHPGKYHVKSDGKWSRIGVSGGPKYIYRTRHNRTNPPRPIEILHVLLRFC